MITWMRDSDDSGTVLPHGAIAIRRGCDCSEHLIMKDGNARCGYGKESGGCWLDAPEDDDTCQWERCPRCYEPADGQDSDDPSTLIVPPPDRSEALAELAARRRAEQAAAEEAQVPFTDVDMESKGRD